MLIRKHFGSRDRRRLTVIPKMYHLRANVANAKQIELVTHVVILYYTCIYTYAYIYVRIRCTN